MGDYENTVCYFIGSSETDRVKIGYTGDIGRRLVDIQVGCPDVVSVLHTMPGSRGTEAMLHRKFAKQHYRGEWFTLSGEIERFILCRQMGLPGDWLEDWRWSCNTVASWLFAIAIAAIAVGLSPTWDTVAFGFAVVAVVGGGAMWLRNRNAVDVDPDGTPQIDYRSPDWVNVKVIR